MLHALIESEEEAVLISSCVTCFNRVREEAVLISSCVTCFNRVFLISRIDIAIK